ncbi:hypothetical protein ACFFWD_25810 [Bradyrhizobium erythrophlei]|uniref:hypothetical protein n=1 Tax=Bradyrhizobium erythrophlei TaxID=1437360 RepID=UPI0035E53F79
MALHRDIHWLGRQWAVTGHGLQLINQKQMGYYDIEIARLWEAGLIHSMQTKAWINREDFDKALEVARARFADAAPAGEPPPLQAVVSRPTPARRAPVEPPTVPTIEELLAKLKSRSAAVTPAVEPQAPARAAQPNLERSRSEPPEIETPKESPKAARGESEPSTPVPPPPAQAQPAARPVDPAPSARPKPAWPVFDRKIAGRARFVRPWRATLTRWHGDLPGLPPRR